MEHPHVHPKELESVLRQNDAVRYEYFVKKVADWQAVWGLFDGTGWALAADDAGNQLIPVWPTREFAAACALNEWSGLSPKEIPVDVFMERWLIGMAKAQQRPAVFPTPSGRGIAVEAMKLHQDLADELDKLE